MRIEKATVINDAPVIVRRLRSGTATVSGLMKQYHSAYSTIMAAVLSVISESEYEQIRYRLLSRGGVRTRLKPGHKTWNKGKKGLVNPGCEKTWFKKAHAPYSHAPGHKVRPQHIASRESKPISLPLITKQSMKSWLRRHHIDNCRSPAASRGGKPAGDQAGKSLPQAVRDSLESLRETISWWECIGCAYEFQGESPFRCPKCGGLRFAAWFK
jgi:hypothetical protein